MLDTKMSKYSLLSQVGSLIYNNSHREKSHVSIEWKLLQVNDAYSVPFSERYYCKNNE